MRLRSEWLTLFTMTALVAVGVALPRADAPIAAAAKRSDMAAAGIDYMPIGTARAVGRAKAMRARAVEMRP